MEIKIPIQLPDNWEDKVVEKLLAKGDFVEVVRCKDCTIPHNRFTGCPKLNGLIPPENHFCSFGERKEGDTE